MSFRAWCLAHGGKLAGWVMRLIMLLQPPETPDKRGLPETGRERGNIVAYIPAFRPT